MGEVTNLASGGVLDITDGRGYKPRQRWSLGHHGWARLQTSPAVESWTSRMGEVTNLASGGVGLVPSEMSTYFRAVL